MYLEGNTLKHIVNLLDLMCQAQTHIKQLRKQPEPHSSYFPLRELDTNTHKMHQELVALTKLYAEYEPKVVPEQSLTALESMQQAIDDTFELFRSFSIWQQIWHMRKYSSQKSKAYDKIELKARIFYKEMYVAIDEMVEYTLNSMPIPLSEHTTKLIHYEQIRHSPQGTMQLAFALFEQYLRTKIGVGPEVFGEELINAAFGKNGSLTYGELPAEKVGIRNLVSGIYATFRNPRMHRILADDEPTAMTIIALLDLLIKIVDGVEEEN